MQMQMVEIEELGAKVRFCEGKREGGEVLVYK